MKIKKPKRIMSLFLAALMCVTTLSEKSIALGGMPQSVPDFTEGKWILRPSKDVTELS